MNQLDIFMAPVKHYHNTVPLHGKELTEANNRAAKQDALVLKCFRPGLELSPDQVHLMLGQQFLLTSVRRSFCNLTKEGKLLKTGKQRIGMYGVNVNLWKLV